MRFTASIEPISGFKPANNQDYPLMHWHHIFVGDYEEINNEQYEGQGLDDYLTQFGTALAQMVTFGEAQELTAQEKAQARANIGAADVATVVRFDQAQTLTDEQKAQARDNIGAGEVDDTLSVAGMAADAKVTGDEISGLKDDLSIISQEFLLPEITPSTILGVKITKITSQTYSITGRSTDTINRLIGTFIPEIGKKYQFIEPMGSDRDDCYIFLQKIDGTSTWYRSGMSFICNTSTPIEVRLYVVNNTEIDTRITPIITEYPFMSMKYLSDKIDEMTDRDLKRLKVLNGTEILAQNSVSAVSKNATQWVTNVIEPTQVPFYAVVTDASGIDNDITYIARIECKYSDSSIEKTYIDSIGRAVKITPNASKTVTEIHLVLYRSNINKEELTSSEWSYLIYKDNYIGDLQKSVNDLVEYKESSSVIIDSLLTLEGDISALKDDLSTEINTSSIENNPLTKGMWRVGSISPTTGASATNSASIALGPGRFLYPSDGNTYLVAEDGYKFYVFAYNIADDSYAGAWDGVGLSKSWSTYKTVTVFYTAKYKALYKFKVALIRDDGADMTTDEYSNLRVFYSRWTEGDGVRTKLLRDNLADDTTKVRGYLTTTGEVDVANEISSRETTTDYIPVLPNAIYRITVYTEETVNFWFRMCVYDAQKAFIFKQDDTTAFPYIDNWRNFKAKTFLYTTPSNASFIRVAVRHGFCIVTQGVTEWDYMISPVDIRRHWSLRPKQDYFVKTVNHRGYGRIAPENTAPAFELSADLGFWGVENDIRFTSDGVAVLMHDPTINRTGRNADGTAISEEINIADITYEQALTYDFGIWMGDKYAGTKIMTFEEFVALCRKKSLHMYNEIKTGTEAQVAELVQTVKRYGMDKHCTWCSFSTTYLNLVCRYDTDARIGLILSAISMESIDTLKQLKNGTNTVYVATHINNNTSLTNELIDALIAEDIALEMYTPNFTDVINAMNPYVTGVTSDWLIAGDVLYNDVNNIMVFDA